MSILTLEIHEKPVACISAKDRTTAEEIARQSRLHRELLAYRSHGAPLWDGSTELSLRHPTQKETKMVESRFEALHLADDPHCPEKPAIVFLVPLDSDGQGEEGDIVEEGDDFPI